MTIESSPESQIPLQLRFHHISQIQKMHELTYAIPEIVRLTSVHKSPELVESLAVAYSEEDISLLNTGHIGELEREYSKDFLGENGDRGPMYQESIVSVARRILSAKPDERVQFTEVPDIVCFTCPRNGDSQPGNHCLAPGVAEADNLYKAEVINLRNDPSTPKSMKKDIQMTINDAGEPTLTVSAKTLRSANFYNRVSNNALKEMLGIKKQYKPLK